MHIFLQQIQVVCHLRREWNENFKGVKKSQRKGVRNWLYEENFVGEDSKKEALNSEGNAEETKKQEIDLRQKQTTRGGTVSHFMAPNLENIFLQSLSPHWYAPSTLFSPGLEFTTSE